MTLPLRTNPHPRATGGSWHPLLLAAGFLLVAIGGAADLLLDRPATWRSTHVVFEAALMLTSLGLATWTLLGWWRASRSLTEAQHSMEERELAHSREREAWRESARPALEGVSRAIDHQFTTWGLTPAEREIARLLLKGHGHKQVASLTGRSERTVRQHAVAIYQKAGVTSRAELAAFFLEAL